VLGGGLAVNILTVLILALAVLVSRIFASRHGNNALATIFIYRGQVLFFIMLWWRMNPHKRILPTLVTVAVLVLLVNTILLLGLTGSALGIR
jgi:hypothetical protein